MLSFLNGQKPPPQSIGYKDLLTWYNQLLLYIIQRYIPIMFKLTYRMGERETQHSQLLQNICCIYRKIILHSRC